MRNIPSNESKIRFLMSMRCWVHPFCYVPPSQEECYRIIASGLECGKCTFRIEDEKNAKEYYGIYERLMTEREKKHYDFLNSERWKKVVRPTIVKHDNHSCLICKETVDMKHAHVHHIMDFSADEDLSPQNLVTLCTKCHAKLHPVFPRGMWAVGWPNLDKVKIELKRFYEKVRETSRRNKTRFKAPLEHLMMHICIICPHLEECDMGKFTLSDISRTMEGFNRLLQKQSCISGLKDRMKHLIVEGKIINMSEPKEVETRYGKTQLVIAQLKDETGEIPLNLYGEQVGKVKAGDVITIENAYTLLYVGKLTLNIPREGGRIITTNKTTSHLNHKASEMESYPYHKIVVDKLEGSSHKGEFSEVSILEVSKNQHYSCPNDCLYYEKYECRYKKPLTNNPVKDKLICTTVLAEIGSSLPPDVGVLLVTDTNRLLNSKGRSYRGFSSYLCENLHSQAKQKFGYISRGAFDCIQIFEGTKERILLPFPEISEKENIAGIILQLWSRKGVTNKSVETFDFRLKPIS